jgi:hypothetical protein
MAAGSTYTPIQSYTLGSAQADVTFNSISGSYTDLVLVISGQMSGGGGASAVQLQFNSDAGSNYSVTLMTGDGSSATSSRNSNQSAMTVGLATDASGQVASNIFQIMNYSNATTNKTVIARAGIAGDRMRATVGLWRNTQAITTIKVINNGGTTFTIGSTFTLYGIASA